VPLAVENRAQFQWLADEIRYLADQWNNSAEQRIWAALTAELQWKFGFVRKWRFTRTSGRALARRAAGQWPAEPGERAFLRIMRGC
jgi:hypothetical protein